MLELTGKYNTAKVFTDVVDQSAISQIVELCNQEFVAESQIRIMPDVHAGAGCTIGTTMTITDKVVPNLVGVDIGCGMLVVKLKEKVINLEKLDQVIRERVPAGFEVRTVPDELWADRTDEYLKELYCKDHVDCDRALLSVGTLGGGNHFVEVDRDDDNNLYLVIHTGSRHLGLQIAKYYQDLAYDYCNRPAPDETKKVIQELKAKGRHKEIEKALLDLKKVKHTKIPKDLCYLEGNLRVRYLHDMGIAQNYAQLNRFSIAGEILSAMGLNTEDFFTTVHNYISVHEGILRKGAVSAREGEEFIVPINMRDGSLICIGKGNADWNCSAPHGAGRLMSRSAAKEVFSVEEFRAEMEGVFSTSVSKDTIDECPMAYKGMKDIVNNIGPTAEIVKIIRPIYNFKAGGE